jgi:hypothetical protein
MNLIAEVLNLAEWRLNLKLDSVSGEVTKCSGR